PWPAPEGPERTGRTPSDLELPFEVIEQRLSLGRSQPPNPAVLAELEFLHDPTGLDFPDTGQRLEDGDDLQLGDSIVALALSDQFAERERASLELLLELRPLAPGGGSLL